MRNVGRPHKPSLRHRREEVIVVSMSAAEVLVVSGQGDCGHRRLRGAARIVYLRRQRPDTPGPLDSRGRLSLHEFVSGLRFLRVLASGSLPELGLL